MINFYDLQKALAQIPQRQREVFILSTWKASAQGKRLRSSVAALYAGNDEVEFHDVHVVDDGVFYRYSGQLYG